MAHRLCLSAPSRSSAPPASRTRVSKHLRACPQAKSAVQLQTHVKALCHFAEDHLRHTLCSAHGARSHRLQARCRSAHVLAIQPWRGDCAQEEPASHQEGSDPARAATTEPPAARAHCDPLVLGPALAMDRMPGPVCLTASTGVLSLHCQQRSCTRTPHTLEVLVLEGAAINGLAACAVSGREVTSLQHGCGTEHVQA